MSEFVSFEIAKKLKEKGFDRPCTYAYCEKGGWNKYKQAIEILGDETIKLALGI